MLSLVPKPLNQLLKDVSHNVIQEHHFCLTTKDFTMFYDSCQLNPKELTLSQVSSFCDLMVQYVGFSGIYSGEVAKCNQLNTSCLTDPFQACRRT